MTTMRTTHSPVRSPSGGTFEADSALPESAVPHSTAPVTITAALLEGTARLAQDSESARLDAEILLSRILAIPRSSLIIRATDALTDDALREYRDLLNRRAHGMPIAYLIGQREFWSLPFAVTPAVLVPRPETELLVEAALRALPADQSRSVLDLGTGSGAIALSIASERPLARITAVDISSAALGVARANATSLNLDRVDWRCGSWFEPVAGERFDVIVSNPPYVASNDPAVLRLAAEPAVALTPGPTGLEALETIIAHAASHLNSDGWLLLEHGNTQAAAVAELLSHHDFDRIQTDNDYSGRPRVTLGRASSPPITSTLLSSSH